MKVLVAFSGGKDSQSSLIWAVNKFKKENVSAVFCDTNWENPITYKHIINVVNDLEVKCVDLRSKKYTGMIDLAEKKKRFPSAKERFCTPELKSIPFIDYVLDQNEHLLIIQGIRAQESFDRSQMQKQCRFFKYYFEPYSSNKITIEKLSKLRVITNTQKKKFEKAKMRLEQGKNDEKFHTYRKNDVFEWVKKYSDDILRPVFDWTGQQVIDYIIENGQKPNELYKQGFKRVGCFPCILSGHKELYELIKRYPKRFEEIIEHEKRIGSSFFKIDSIPKYAQTGYDKKSGKKFTTAEDLKNYLIAKNKTGSLFCEDEAISCSSYYNLCE